MSYCCIVIASKITKIQATKQHVRQVYNNAPIFRNRLGTGKRRKELENEKGNTARKDCVEKFRDKDGHKFSTILNS